MIWTILLFLAVLSVLVIAHEWGHFFTAKKIGAEVEEFGLGFPPRIFTWKGKDGMIWSLNAIPLGGFVKITGESGGELDNPNSFARKSIPKRLLVLTAGVIMNLVVAAILFSVGFAVGIPSVTEGDIDKHVTVTDQAIRVTEVIPGSPADAVGVQLGDTILSMNGQTYTEGEVVRQELRSLAETENVAFVIERDGEELELDIAPAFISELEGPGVGVAIVETGLARYPWYLVIPKGIETTAIYTVTVVVAFYEIIRDAITGAGVAPEISGPVGIAVLTGEIAGLGFVYLMQFAAILSINLAVINILPFPALDGGRVAFTLLEAVRKKPVSPKVEAIVHNSGFLLLMLLVIIVTYRDIVNLF